MGSFGCGLLDLESFRGITFSLPEKSYAVDTADPKWKTPPSGTAPTVTCGPGRATQDCCALPEPLGSTFAIDCQKYPLVCWNGQCAFQFTFEMESLVDLKKEVPQLASTATSALSDIVLKNIKITLNNGLNIPLPPIEVFVAPQDAASGADPRAKKIAVVPAHPAGFMGTETYEVDAAGQAAFSQFATNFQTPFKVIARTLVTIEAGQSAPSGKATAKIGGQVEAKI